MHLSRLIATNTLIHTVGKFSGSLIGLVVIGLLTRYLGTEGYGYYTTIFAYLFFFATIGDLGLYLITVNELGRDGVDKKKLFSNIFTMRLVSGLILMALASGIVWFFPYPLLVKLGTLITSLTMLMLMIDQITTALFQEQMKTKYVAIAEIFGKIVMLGLIFLIIKLDLGFLPVLWTVAGGVAVHFMINIFFSRKLLKFSLSFEKQIWQNIFKKSWPVATYMIFSMIYFKADTIILSLYHPQNVVGLYGAPYKILEVLISFPAIFMGLVLPHLSRAFSKNNLTHFKDIFQKAFDFLCLVSWPLIFGTIVLADKIINLIAGQEFLASAGILKIIIIATGIIFIAHLSTFSIVAIGKQKQMMKFYIIAAVGALVLYFVLIPKYSYWAAALVTVAVEFFILYVSWMMVMRTLRQACPEPSRRTQGGFVISFKNNFLSLASSTIMACILYLTNINLFASIILGGIIYIGGIYLMGAFKKELITRIFGFLKNTELKNRRIK